MPVGINKVSRNSQIGGDIPDSAVLNAKASDYDSANNNWVSNIGPNIPDASGDPTKTQMTVNGTEVDVVSYVEDDVSHTNTAIADGDPIAVIYVAKLTTPDDPGHFIDGGSADEFTHRLDGTPEHDILSSGSRTQGGTPDSTYRVYTLEGDDSSFSLRLNDNSPLISDNGGFSDMTGFTVGGRGDLSDGTGGNRNSIDISEVTILENHSTSERDSEISRLMSEYPV